MGHVTTCLHVLLLGVTPKRCRVGHVTTCLHVLLLGVSLPRPGLNLYNTHSHHVCQFTFDALSFNALTCRYIVSAFTGSASTVHVFRRPTGA